MRKILSLVAILLIVIVASTGCYRNVTIISKRIDDATIDIRQYMKNGTDHGDVNGWVSWWSVHHKYAIDSVRIATSEGQYLPSISDFWLFPDETEYLVNTYNVINCDCEDGAIKGAADLIANGQPAYFCIGWLSIDGIWYGHAWIECDGKLIETTTTPAVIVEGRPSFYKLSIRCNLDTVYVSKDVGIPESLPGLPPNRLPDLFSSLTGGSIEY